MSNRKTRFRRIFVVADPTQMVQSALLRAEAIARLNSAELELYCCLYDADADEKTEDRERETAKAREWLERIVAMPRSAGIHVDTRLEWKEDWREALADAASRAECDLIVKTSSKHSRVGRMLRATSDWMLLRHAACPTLLVNKAMPSSDARKLLAAVKLKPEDDEHERLNEQILGLSHYLADVAGFELHAVTAYKGDEVYYDRQAFANRCRLPRNRVVSVEGAPHNAIAKAAAEIGADTVVIGDPGDSETAQLVIDQITTDLLVLPGVR